MCPIQDDLLVLAPLSVYTKYQLSTFIIIPKIVYSKNQHSFGTVQRICVEFAFWPCEYHPLKAAPAFWLTDTTEFHVLVVGEVSLLNF